MHNLPPLIPPQQFTDAAAALAHVREIYDAGIAHLRAGMQRFVAGDDSLGPVRAFYPLVRIHTETVLRQPAGAQAGVTYGFVAGPGVYETTLTRPDLFANYYLEQFSLLLLNHGVALEVLSS